MTDTLIRKSNSFRRIRALCRTMRKTKWRLYNEIVLRTNDEKTFCPLQFIMDEQYDYCPLAMEKLGFTNRECRRIMEAADTFAPISSKVAQMRRILFRAVNLKRFERAVFIKSDKLLNDL